MRRAATVLCDDIAAIVAARDEPEVIKLQDRMVSRAGAKESTVFNGRGGKADRFSAAVANGAAADWCELDEGYRRATCHAGLYVIPALIAEAEATGASTEDTLRALVLGYEVAARFARAFPPKALVLHPHASLAAIGAAAGVGALRRLDAKAAQCGADLRLDDGGAGAVSPRRRRRAGAQRMARGGSVVRHAGCGVGGVRHRRCAAFAVRCVRRGVQFEARGRPVHRRAGRRMGDRGRLPQGPRLLSVLALDRRGDHRPARPARRPDAARAASVRSKLIRSA